MTSAGRWEWVHGASWLTEGGVVYPVPGFHEAWIAENAEFVPGCRNVCDVVLSKRWVSLGVYSKGYVELLVPCRSDWECLERARVFLEKSLGKWDKALFLTMGEEGYVKISPEDVVDAPSFFGNFVKPPEIRPDFPTTKDTKYIHEDHEGREEGAGKNPS
ncbi:MAG: hypothetical protein NT080_03760 [Spirochaetes bacterium]|nr:hypothetical protein [Spirochaetota bacterium]